MTNKKRGRPSKIESSPNYDYILDLMSKQKKPDYISECLKEKGESIHPDTIKRFMQKKFNVKEEGIKQSFQREIKREKKLKEAGKDYADITERIRNIAYDIFSKLDLDQLTQGQLAQLLPQVLRALKERESLEGEFIINIESDIGEENIFVYTEEEMNMIKEWGNKPNDFLDNI